MFFGEGKRRNVLGFCLWVVVSPSADMVETEHVWYLLALRTMLPAHAALTTVYIVRREKVLREEQQRREAQDKLARLRKRHEADKESARRTYMESKRCGKACVRLFYYVLQYE